MFRSTSHRIQYTQKNKLQSHQHPQRALNSLKTNPAKKSQVESPQVPKNDKNPDPGLPDPLAATSKLRAVDLGQVEASLHLHPPPFGVQSCFPIFFSFGVLIFWLFFFGSLLFFEGLAKQKKVAGHNSLSLCFGSVVSLENHEKNIEKRRYHGGKLTGHGLGNFVFDLLFNNC